MKLPFVLICTNCNRTVDLVDTSMNKDIFGKKDIDVIGSPYYDSAIVTVMCDCGNEIEL